MNLRLNRFKHNNMKIINPLGIVILVFITMLSCTETKKKTTTAEKVEPVASKITISKLVDSPAYTAAALTLEADTESNTSKDGQLNFDFTVKNYDLGVQTQSANAERLANSGKGQHIHFILNNQPYSAHYEASFTKEIPEGVHHLLAFLSRSYHESVKNENAFIVQKLAVGDNPVDSLGIAMDAPTLIYSRPKGKYIGKDTDQILLDFYILNDTLSETGTKVKATINGQEFMITEWSPYVISGLPKGEATIELQLLDANGNQIPGPFNAVSRTIGLE